MTLVYVKAVSMIVLLVAMMDVSQAECSEVTLVDVKDDSMAVLSVAMMDVSQAACSVGT